MNLKRHEFIKEKKKLCQKNGTKRTEKSKAVKAKKFQKSVDEQNFKEFTLYLTFWFVKG